MVLSILVIAMLRALRGNSALMRHLSEDYVQPIHRRLAILTDAVPFSIAELLILIGGAVLLTWIGVSLVRLFRNADKRKQLWKMLCTLLALGLSIYMGFCILWGVYYYGDDFAQKSGLEAREISVRELETVTRYFAELANQYAEQVPRSADGSCSSDRFAVLRKSGTLYRQAEKEYPCLGGPPVRAKPFFLSKFLSLMDFTGFFFPFTAEANVNMDFPPSLFAATVAHELAHQRGVAKEQEANFCAVLASLLDGDPDYCYSACLLAYTHLGNALHSADREAWEDIYRQLSEEVRKDFAVNRVYWDRFRTPMRSISNVVYEGFLYSYDQVLGLKSYGACVDMLVCHYLEEAEAAHH